MPDEKKYLKQWRDGNNLYYFYDEDAHTELNALGSELATKIAAEDVYDKTSIDEKIVELQNSDNENSLKITSLKNILEANKIFATIKSVPTHGTVTTVDGEELNVKDKLLVSKDSIPYSNGLGQVNFRVKMDDGFKEKVTVKDNEGYKNIKSEVLEDGTVEYKITKIFDEINILITEEEITEEPNGYRVNFIGEKFTIKVLSQDYDGINDYFIDPEINTETEKRTYTRNYDNGGTYAKYSAGILDDVSTPDVDETKPEVKPQIQFIVIPNEGYDVSGKPVISGTYKNDKSGESTDGKYYIYKYTVIKSDLNIEIKTEVSDKTLADYHITNAYTKEETNDTFYKKVDANAKFLTIPAENEERSLVNYRITDVYSKTDADNKFIEKPTSEKTLADYNISDAATQESVVNAVAELNNSISQTYALKTDVTDFSTRVETLESNNATTNSNIKTINSTLGNIYLKGDTYSRTEVDNKFSALPSSYYTETDAEKIFAKKADSFTKDEVNNLLGTLKTEILGIINLPTLSGKYTLTVSGEGNSLVYNWEKVQDPSTGEETV